MLFAALLACLLDPTGSGAAPLETGRPYLVLLEEGLEGTGYERAAERLAAFRGGEVLRWRGAPELSAKLQRELVRRAPRYLALVLTPEAIDANLPRRLVPLLCRFDDDPFADCAFGVITGATGEDAEAFVANIRRASAAPLPARKTAATSVVVDECLQIGPRPQAGPAARTLATTDLWITGEDDGWPAFLAARRHAAAGGGLVEWGHCGDSQGIWLFSMYRNRERDKHWRFDPDKVGQDPDGELPRLTPAALLEGVDLFPSVVLNGSCHSAVTCDTVVGPDIVSTFGDTGGRVVFHAITPEQSFPLQAIAHGAVAYLAPLAANNANRAAIEEWWIRRGGVALGDVVKFTHDELVLGAVDHELQFAEFVDGRPEPRESPMFHDTVHRVLFGDPAYVPWPDQRPTTHQQRVEELGRGLRVTVDWSQLREDPFVWDPWRERDPRGDRGERGRLHERVVLASAPRGRPEAEVEEAWAMRGEERREIALEATALLERDPDGAAVLHLKASGPRAAMDARGASEGPDSIQVVFRVRWRR